jgi:NMD protein affecting ribosome stability and mRNA decay
LLGREMSMLCKICGVKQTYNFDGVCDECKFSILQNDEIPPYFENN